MEKIPLRLRILHYLERNDGWINGGEIERLAMSAGYKASNASRRCRELYEMKLIERREDKSVWYRAKRKIEQLSLV